MKKILLAMCMAVMAIVGVQAGNMSAAEASDVWCYTESSGDMALYIQSGETYVNDAGALLTTVKVVNTTNNTLHAKWHYSFMYDEGNVYYVVLGRTSRAKSIEGDEWASSIYYTAAHLTGYMGN